MVYSTLCRDVVDTSANNPCLLTLANRSPQRIQKGQTMVATTLPGGCGAGVNSIIVASGAGVLPLQWLFLDGPNPDVVQVSASYVSGATIPLAMATVFTHGNGALVTNLPTIITDEEPRIPITGPEGYWRLVCGPYHEFHDPSVEFRTPTRLYQAFMWVKTYDTQPSHKLSEDVVNRLDFLLNLGESSAAQSLGTSTSIYIEKAEIREVPDPRFDHSTLANQIPVQFRFVFSKIYT